VILLLDNYDSFTYILLDYFKQAGTNPVVLRNDEMSLNEFKELPLDALIISPGPERPEKAGLLMPILNHFVQDIPVFGICLGHQAIGIQFGGQLERAPQAIHGKTTPVITQSHYLFNGMDAEIDVMRYHSLVIEGCPPSFEIIAQTRSGINMAMQHQNLPVTSVQFHPESILTDHGFEMIKNWVKYHKF
jgi:para-aminobenzoate synthetase component 2